MKLLYTVLLIPFIFISFLVLQDNSTRQLRVSDIRESKSVRKFSGGGYGLVSHICDFIS